MKSGKMLACAILGLGLLYHASVFAEDGLYLCGIVNDVDTQNGTVSIDVKSEGCRGPHTFKLPAANGMPSVLVDEKKCFYIESRQCETGKIYTITKLIDHHREAASPVKSKERADQGGAR